MSNYTGKGGSASGAGRRQLYGSVAVPSNMEVEVPTKEDLKQRKIIVSTLVTSGRYGTVWQVWHGMALTTGSRWLSRTELYCNPLRIRYASYAEF